MCFVGTLSSLFAIRWLHSRPDLRFGMVPPLIRAPFFLLLFRRLPRHAI
jgi:hypothetical protein